MDTVIEETTPLKTLTESKTAHLDCKTPPPIQLSDQDSGNDLKKPNNPDRLKVPKAFKYPERYRSPTDAMMSPVTKGLLARNRKNVSVLPPSLNLTKDIRIQDVGLFQK